MESKKINQLATELTPALSDLTIIGDPTTGISKKITLSQMASLFTGTVEEYASVSAFPLVGVADTIYIALDTNVLYRWDTTLTSYVELSPNIINSLVFSDANGFDGTISLVGSTATLTITTALTTGSVAFIGASGALLQDNANFFWDDTNNRLGIGTNAPTTTIDAFGSGIIGRLNGTSTNNSFLGFASAGTNKWSIGNVQSDHRFRIYSEATTSELVSVLSTGEFGIGIANPTTKLHIDGGASALIANLDANVSVAKSVSFRSDNSNRFNIEVSGTESGSNAGADLFIRRYSDAGALIDTPLTIRRSTGLISLATALNGTSAGFSVEISTPNIILTSNSSSLKRDINTSYLEITGGGDSTSGQAQIRLYGKNASSGAGNSAYYADNLYIYNSTSPNTFKAVFDSNGRLGINNQTPLLGLHVEKGLSSSPSTSGTTPNGLVIFKPSDGTNALLFGAYASSPNGLWIQGQSTAALGTNFPIYINPNGGNVAIGGTGISRRLQVNTSGNDGIRILTSGDNPTLDLMQSAAANAGARNWRIVTNWEGWGTFDVQSGTTNTQDPATTRLSIKGTTGDIGIGGTAWNKLTVYTSSTNAFDVFDTGSGFGIGMQAINNLNTIYRSWDFYATKFNYFGSSSGPTIDIRNNNNTSGDNALTSRLGGNCSNTSSYLFVGETGAANKIFIYGNGNVVNANNSYGSMSDIKLKENIYDTTNKLSDLLKVKIRNYNFIGNTQKQIGVIAQELEEIFPSMIDETEDFEEVEIIDSEGNIAKEKKSLGTFTKSVKYSVFVPMLIKAIQELNNKIDAK